MVVVVVGVEVEGRAVVLLVRGTACWESERDRCVQPAPMSVLASWDGGGAGRMRDSAQGVCEEGQRECKGGGGRSVSRPSALLLAAWVLPCRRSACCCRRVRRTVECERDDTVESASNTEIRKGDGEAAVGGGGGRVS